MMQTPVGEAKQGGGRALAAAPARKSDYRPFHEPWAMAQPTYGNQAVQRMMDPSRHGEVTLRRKCACGGGEDHGCAECERKNEGDLHRAAAQGGTPGAVPAIVHNVLRSPAQRLDRDARAYFEPRFGRDFGDVRVHTGAEAAASARAVGALAYTVGRDVVFGGGQYAPASTRGRKLLAHELAHVVQQPGGLAARSALRVDPADSPSEREADRMADAALGGREVQGGAAPLAVQRQADDGGSGGEAAPATPAAPGAPAPATPGDAAPAPATPGDESADYRELTEAEKAAITVHGQAATTPDGNALGPTDPAHRGCLGTDFFFARGADINTVTEAHGHSIVTARLHEPPGQAADCSCGCGLFRQFIRGSLQLGSPTSAPVSPFVIGSCAPNTITLTANTFTEEFVNCVTGGVPIGPGCSRTQGDIPGLSGLSEGTFVHLHFVLRYQMWDQCRGTSLGIADHVLDISGSRSPRRITFT